MPATEKIFILNQSVFQPKALIVLAIAVAAFLLAVWYYTKQMQEQSYPREGVVLNKHFYSFLLADTEEARVRGLSGKGSLPADTVLLFSYEKDSDCGIWMKDMKFPIDVVWLDRNFTIIDFKEKISPATYPQIFSPKSLCRYFIEAEQGFVRANDIRIGQKVSIDFADYSLHF